ncbi:helix-turn-helix domain-containing protein [Mucilaginibacter koreensis]
MIHLGILLTQQYRLLSIAAILDVFDTVNHLTTVENSEAAFQIQLLCLDDEMKHVASTLRPGSGALLAETAKLDVILIPAFATNSMQQAIQQNQAFIPWLHQQFRGGASLASFCTGAFLLGASGLLKGKAATTHVDACGAFAAAFPDVKLMPYQVVTSDDGIYTSGGSTSSFHLMLHLVTQYCGREMAIRTAKIFAIDMDRQHQTYFATFSPSNNHQDELVAKAQRNIEAGYRDAATIEEMIKDLPSSRRNMVRRFKQATGCTPIEYLQKLRIEGAKKLLEQTRQQMTEVMFNSGYNDQKAFRKIFKKNVGMTPTEYREKFQIN